MKKLPLEHLWIIIGVLVTLFMAFRFWTADNAHTKLQKEVVKTEQVRTKAAHKEEVTLVKQETVHEVEVTKAKNIHNEKTKVRAVDHTGELARVERLRFNQENRAATYRAQARATETVRRDLVDRLEALDRNTVEGVAVVTELRSTLDKRDSEVVLLRTVIDADRKLMASPQ